MEKDSKINIYAVADIHGQQDRLDLIKNHVTILKPDVLVIARDITGHHELFSLIRQLNDLPIPVLAVRGNGYAWMSSKRFPTGILSSACRRSFAVTSSMTGSFLST